MKIEISLSSLKQGRWYEYVVRFALGGLITAATGLIASRYGPSIAGLFLAFPAIFPASATLVAKHEEDRKRRLGLSATERGKDVAALDACGAAMGSVGLFLFAALVWLLLPNHHPLLVLSCAAAAWAAGGFALWRLRH